MTNYTASAVRPLIEAHFHRELIKNEYFLKSINAIELLHSTRLDIAFKLIFLRMARYDISFSRDIYVDHIRALSLGTFTEPGNESKDSINKYILTFNEVLNDIKRNNFDSSKTLIPLSKNGSIANGSHRVASAIFLEQKVTCVGIYTSDHIYDYKFFYERNVSSDTLDIVATTFTEFSSNVHIAFLWPVAVGCDEEIERIIPNIVYRKNITLNLNGAHNLLSQVYFGEEWLGGVDNNFSGCQHKLIECFKSLGALKIIAFQSESLNDVLIIKERIRALFNVGKHSIHITDTKAEAVRAARIVFNDNSIHFLNYAMPNKYTSLHKKIEKFKEVVSNNKIDFDSVILDGGIVLSAYGLRECNDIDYLTVNDDELECHDEELECHDKELEYHDEEKLELIFNPRYYFYFNGVKFISFSQLYKMKRNRDEGKDKNDCNTMEALVENKKIKQFISQMKQAILYSKAKMKYEVIKRLKRIISCLRK